MDWSNFDECFERLRNVLSEKAGNGKNGNKIDIYANYLDYGGEIKLVVRRIEAETQRFVALTKRLSDMLRAHEEPQKVRALVMETDENFTLLQLDIKSFFIFTRIFLDTLARIIRLCFKQKGEQLPYSMTELPKHEKLMELDSDFAEGLKDRMLLMENFVERRVEIEHYLGSIRSTITKDGEFMFDLLGQRNPRFWGTDTVTSITDYMEDIIFNLSKVILYIHQKFQS